MPTDSLSGAITAAFLADAGCVAAMPGGIWLGEAQEGTPLPYCELATPGGDVMQTSEKPYVETSPVKFTVWAVGEVAAESCGKALLSLFLPRNPFSFQTAKLLHFLQRGSDTPTPSDRRNENGDVVFRLDLPFEALVQRAKP